MKYKHLLSRLGLGTAGLLLAGQSYALGTTADLTVTNTVTMDYQVNSVDQQTVTTADFEVDRRYIVRVNSTDTNWVSAIPGQQFNVTNETAIHFAVTNETNDTVRIRLALADRGNTAISAPFDAPGAELLTTTVNTWQDTNGNGVYDDGVDVLIGTGTGLLPTLGAPFAADETRDYYVSIDVAGGTASDLYEAYTLIAAVADGTDAIITTDDAGNASVGETPDPVASNDLGAVENVFSDPAAVSPEDFGFNFGTNALDTGADTASNGQAADTSGFRTRVALDIVKYVETLWDPISGNAYSSPTVSSGNEPKSIPGAVMLYVVAVRAGSGLDATDVEITDDIDTSLVDLGNPAGATIQIPSPLSIDVNGTLVPFDLSAVSADLNYYVQDCAGSAVVTSGGFDGDPEINVADLGDCDAGDTGYVAYVVTVDDGS